MSVFDLLFLGIFLATLVTLLVSLVAVVRGRRSWAGVTLKRLGLFLTAYMGIVVLVSLVTPPVSVGLGDIQCFDDWCITVEDVDLRPHGDLVAYDVHFRLSSQARGRPQREAALKLYLTDEEGTRYWPEMATNPDGFDQALGPGQSATAVRTFLVPKGRQVALVAGHGWFPGLFIIGDGESLAHKTTVVDLGAPG